MSQLHPSDISRSFPVVHCPGCKTAMTPVLTESAAKGMHRTTYRCETCSADTDLIYKGDGNTDLLPRR